MAETQEKLSVSLYDLAKMQIKNEEPMEKSLAFEKYKEMAKFISKYKYAMLLNRERADYTILHRVKSLYAEEEIAALLEEIVSNRGLFLLCDKVEDKVNDMEIYEIWIRDAETNEDFCYYLFDYNMGVINY